MQKGSSLFEQPALDEIIAGGVSGILEALLCLFKSAPPRGMRGSRAPPASGVWPPSSSA